MPHKFIATGRSQYFARSGDLVFYNSEHFLLKIKPLIEKDSSYENFFVGFVVNRKVGNAVTRNKIKRRLRSIFNSEDFVFHKGFCYILIMRSSISQVSFEKLKISIFEALSKSFSSFRFVNFIKNK